MSSREAYHNALKTRERGLTTASDGTSTRADTFHMLEAIVSGDVVHQYFQYHIEKQTFSPEDRVRYMDYLYAVREEGVEASIYFGED